MKHRLSVPILIAALILLCASCIPFPVETSTPTPTLETASTPTVPSTSTPEPTVEPSPALTGLAGELYAVVENFFSLKRDAVNGVDLSAELADSYLGKEAAARAEAMRAYHEESGTYIVSIETELKDFIVRWIQGSSAMVSVYELTCINYNGKSKDLPATDKMKIGILHDVTLEQNGNGVYQVIRDRSSEYEETNYESELCVVSTNYDWYGNGYAYLSEEMNIRVEFPPAWEKYITFEENDVEGLLRSGKSVRVINLTSGFKLEDNQEHNTTFGRIYWVPKDDERRNTDHGALVAVKLWESDNGAYICEMNTMLQIEFDPNPGAGGPYPEYEEIKTIFETVQSGILAGEWGLEVWRQ